MKAYATIGQEPYTGFDDVLVPEPALPYDENKGQSVPWEIYRETFEFEPIAASVQDKDEDELDTQVYITHVPEDRHTTPKHRAEAWIKKISSIQKSNYKLIEQGTVKLPGVPAIATDTQIEAYRFTIETNGLGVLDSLGTRRYHDDERYVQNFYILPISRDEVVTARAVRNKINDFPHTQFSNQWEHFLKTLKREVANTHSTTQGSEPRTRRYYTHAFSFEIPTPDEDKGNQWTYELGSYRWNKWETPQGEIGLSIRIYTNDDYLNVAYETQREKEHQLGIVQQMPGIATKYKAEVPKMTYLEKSFGTTIAYGHREETEEKIKIQLLSIYKPGKSIEINLHGSKAAMQANEKLIYDWLARFKFLP